MHIFDSATPDSGARHRSRVLVSLGLVMALLFALGGTADAQTERDRSRQVDVVRPDRVVETLRLACAPDFVQGQRGVVCQWSEASNPQTRGYKLFRITDGSARELVTTVGVDGRRGYFDSDVSAPSSLIYGVVSVNNNGRLLGRSAAVHVQFGTDIEQMRLACAPDIVGDQRGVLCRWSESGQPDVRGYLVYRISNDGPREVVARVGLDGRNAHFDTNVVSGASYTYGVTAVDGAGNIVGVGGPQHIGWPATD